MKPRKSKSSGPSLRSRLSADYLKAFQSDFEENGPAVIAELRQKSPEKYAEIASRLIAQAEPPSDDFDKAQSMRDLGIGLLKQVGMAEENITEQMIEAAIEAQDELVRKLELIAALDIGLEIAGEYETRELRS
jgi:hypothetical protein